MSLFANRRKARRIGRDGDDDEGDEQGAPVANPVVRKPMSKAKQKSKVRMTFGTDEAGMDDEEPAVSIPKKLGANRRTFDRRGGLGQPLTPAADRQPLPIAQDERPSYSKEYLEELRNATPSTPNAPPSVDEGIKEVDISAKFGQIAVAEGSTRSVIPSAAEIREKKERRARLAKEYGSNEADFISLDDGNMNPDDSDQEWSLDRKEQKLEDTRLIHDDEDFAEGFDAYVEDGRIALGRKAEREHERRQREEMKALIAEAEGSSEEDESDAERNAAYEATQTRAAMDGMRRVQKPERPKTPPKIAPLPKLSDGLLRLRSTLMMMENSKTQMIRRLEELGQEKSDIAIREVEIQTLLRETGEKYEKLKAEAGVPPEQALLTGPDVDSSRGLENIGGVSGSAVKEASND